MSDKNIKSFLATVGEQIRWKRAREPLLYELETHICDRRDHLVNNGLDLSEAESQAIVEMGDPEDIGLELNRIHRPHPNWALIGCTAFMLLLGMLLLWAVGDREEYFGQMIIYSGIGVAALIVGYFIDYTVLAKLPTAAFFVLCGVCMVLPMLGTSLMIVSAQLCYMLPLFFAILVYRARNGGKKNTILVLVGVIMCYVVAVFSHNWLSLIIYLAVTCSGIIIFAATKRWFNVKRRYVYAFTIGFPLVLYSALCLISHISVLKRIDAVVSPDKDPLGYGWIPLRLREIFDSAKFIGEGATSEYLEIFLTSNQIISVDYTLAAATHRFGLIVFVLVALLAAVIGFVIIKGLKRHSCYFGKLIVIAIGLCFLVRTVGYFAYNLGFSLISFEGLPLFSYCGKLLIFDMFVTGILLSVFRTESIARDSRIKLRT